MTRTAVFKLEPDAPDKKAIKYAAALLREGGLVGFPTETVYGIAASFLNEEAVNRLYDVKKRPRNKPFTVHISDVGMIEKLGCAISPFAEALIGRFWPGPLTIILPLSTGAVCGKARQDKLGFRMPKNKIAETLISESGVPVVAPSANISGQGPATAAARVLDAFDGKIDLILDGGETEFGIESTVVDATADSCRILREGAVAKSEIIETWKRIL